jgi:hypothetical protein
VATVTSRAEPGRRGTKPTDDKVEVLEAHYRPRLPSGYE